MANNLSFKPWLESKENAVRDLVGNLILFFTRQGDLFGAPELSRLVFAKMKEPESESWVDDANFTAFNLMKALDGNRVQNVFGKKDLDDIVIIDPEQAEEMLMGGKKQPRFLYHAAPFKGLDKIKKHGISGKTFDNKDWAKAAAEKLAKKDPEIALLTIDTTKFKKKKGNIPGKAVTGIEIVK